jgi:L-iditol 2-dehydrogenase
MREGGLSQEGTGDPVRAAFFKLPGKVELREVADVQPQAGQVLVRVLASGICGSDDYAYRVGQELGGLVRGGWHRRGHECGGRVVAVGPGTRALRVGDMVAGIGSLPCGKCPACARGASAYCTASRWCGGEGFSEYLCKEEEWFHPIPGLTAEQGALIEPLTVALEMIDDAGVMAGSKVLIVGAGPIGLMAISVCKQRGAERVYVSHPSHSQARLTAAAALGADRVFLSDKDDIAAHLRREHPEGLEAVLLTVRPSAALPLAASVCGLGARISFVGMANEVTDTITIDIDSFHFKKLSMVGSNHNPCSRLYPAAVGLLRSGAVQAEAIITHRFPLARIAEAFAFATAERGKVGKVVIAEGDGDE